MPEEGAGGSWVLECAGVEVQEVGLRKGSAAAGWRGLKIPDGLSQKPRLVLEPAHCCRESLPWLASCLESNFISVFPLVCYTTKSPLGGNVVQDKK